MFLMVFGKYGSFRIIILSIALMVNFSSICIISKNSLEKCLFEYNDAFTYKFNKRLVMPTENIKG